MCGPVHSITGLLCAPFENLLHRGRVHKDFILQHLQIQQKGDTGIMFEYELCEISVGYLETEFLDEIQTIVFRFFLLVIHSLPIQLCLEISISSKSRNLLQFL
jgi:hypothetical protein